MKRKGLFYLFSSLVLLYGVCFNSAAQNVECIYLASGSEVEGYISEQIPGKSITVQTAKATVVVSSDSLQSRYVERIPLASLSAEWNDWAEENKAFIVQNGTKILELSTLTFTNTEYSGVYVLEKGSLIKFIDLNPAEYTFGWNDMVRTVKNRRPDNLFSGLKETIVLNDGNHVSGQILEQIPGKDLKMLKDNGEIHSFKFSEVNQIFTEKLNEEMDLWSQIPLIDVVQVKGEDTPFEGFISSRTMNRELVIELVNGQSKVFPLSSIVSYAKFPNEKYNPLYDKRLAEGEVLLNGEPAYFDNLKTHGNLLLLSDDVASAQMKVGDEVCIEANLSDPDVQITLVKSHMENISAKKRKPLYRPAISFQDLIQFPLAYKKEKTPLGNLKITFEIEEAGDYVLYIQGIEGYIVIYVTDDNLIY